MLSQPQLRPLGRQEIERPLTPKLPELNGEPTGLAVEEVPGAELLDGRHGVGLATAGLPEHEDRGHTTFASEKLRCLGHRWR